MHLRCILYALAVHWSCDAIDAIKIPSYDLSSLMASQGIFLLVMLDSDPSVHTRDNDNDAYILASLYVIPTEDLFRGLSKQIKKEERNIFDLSFCLRSRYRQTFPRFHSYLAISDLFTSNGQHREMEKHSINRTRMRRVNDQGLRGEGGIRDDRNMKRSFSAGPPICHRILPFLAIPRHPVAQMLRSIKSILNSFWRMLVDVLY